MVRNLSLIGAGRAAEMFGDWTDRIKAGELPFAKPQRPKGIERNIVVTLWDWSSPTAYVHDEVSTDRRYPTLNAYGLIYGSPENSSDYAPVLDPVHNKAFFIKLPYQDPKTPTTKNDPMYAPSPYWGDERIWDSHTIPHNPMFDDKGRVWFTSRIRPKADPAFCQWIREKRSVQNCNLSTRFS